MVGMVKVTSLLTLAESVLGFISFGARAQAEMKIVLLNACILKVVSRVSLLCKVSYYFGD